jgi:hypothetical protein
MKLDNLKSIGNAGLSLGIAYFGSNGYIVSIPLNDTQGYDFVVDNGEELLKVEAKSTTFKTKYGIYQVSLKSSGGTRGETYKRVIDGEADLLFILCDNMDMYVIPIKEIKNTTTINLGKQYQKYKVQV